MKVKDSLKLPPDLKNPIEVEDIEQEISLITAGSPENYNKILSSLNQQQSEFIQSEVQRKLKILADFYGVDTEATDGWMLLCGHLAFNLLPGFSVSIPKKRGAKSKWDSYAYIVLWYDVQQMMQQQNTNEFDACYILARAEPWSKVFKDSSSDLQRQKSMYNRYMKAKADPVVRVICINARKPCERYSREFSEEVDQFVKNIREERCKRLFES
jgi:hypothetical protein